MGRNASNTVPKHWRILFMQPQTNLVLALKPEYPSEKVFTLFMTELLTFKKLKIMNGINYNT